MPGVQYIPHPSPPLYTTTAPASVTGDICEQYLDLSSASWTNDDNMYSQPNSNPHAPWSDHPINASYKGYEVNNNLPSSASANPSLLMSYFPQTDFREPIQPSPQMQQPIANYAWSITTGGNSTQVSPCSTPPLSVSGQNSTPHFEFPPVLVPSQQRFDDARTAPSSRPSSVNRIIRDRHRSSPVNVGISSSPSSPLKGPQRRICGACTRCRRLKMKCEFKDDEASCRRCTVGRHDCIQEEKKPRAPGEREKLLTQLRKREAQVDTVIDRVKQEQYSPQQTPLTFVPSKLQVNDQSDDIKSVLVNAHNSVTSSNPNKKVHAAQLHDIRTLLENDEWTFSGNESSSTSSSSLTSPASEYGGIPNVMAPIGFIARASLAQEKEQSFFNPGPLTRHHSLKSILIERGDEAPAILLHGLFNLDEVDVLFDIFFTKIYPMVGMLDPDIHTPSGVLVRSPFLFTVICAIAARHLVPSSSSNPKYALAMHYAKTAAASALIDGSKSIEMCQAYILMCLYAPKGKRFEEDRTWFYSGVAMRLATDLGLHEIPTRPEGTDERSVREWNNKIRTWMVCFNLDRSFSSQYGRPSTLFEDDHIRNTNWYKSSSFNTSYDVHTQGHTGLLKILTKFHDMMKKTNSRVEVENIIEACENELNAFEADLTERYLRDSDPQDEGCRFRVNLNPFTFNYSRLVMISQAMQRQEALDNCSPQSNSTLLMKALHAATCVIRAFIDKVVCGNTGLVRYAPDCYFVYVGFAATFLLKLIDQDSSSKISLDQEQTDRIISLVSALTSTLGSEQVAIDDHHTPKLYSRFLRGLVCRISEVYYTSASSMSASTSSDGSSMTENSPVSGSVSYYPHEQRHALDYDLPSPPEPMTAASSISWDDMNNSTMYDGRLDSAAWTFGADTTWDLAFDYLNDSASSDSMQLALNSSPQMHTYNF